MEKGRRDGEPGRAEASENSRCFSDEENDDRDVFDRRSFHVPSLAFHVAGLWSEE